MTLTPHNLLDLANAGASLTVDANKLSVHHLQQLAAAMAAGDGRLTVLNAQSMTSDNAKLLAGLLGGKVAFDAQ